MIYYNYEMLLKCTFIYKCSILLNIYVMIFCSIKKLITHSFCQYLRVFVKCHHIKKYIYI